MGLFVIVLMLVQILPHLLFFTKPNKLVIDNLEVEIEYKP